MGCLLSKRRRQLIYYERPGPDYIQPRPIDELVMDNKWKLNDLLYENVKMKRQKLEELEMGYLQRIIAKYSICEFPGCKCKGAILTGIKRDNFGWINSICERSGCKHQLCDHLQNLRNASYAELMVLVRVIFDIMNTKVTIKNISKKPRTERNILLKGLFESLYKVLYKSVLRDPYTLPYIDTIYGSPPFERTNIEQILLNFCMYTFNDNDKLELKNALIVTKFVLKYFDTWMWNIPQELLKCNSREYSKSYNYYYRRFLMYCCLPRCAHSISLRYRPTKIFGQDVLNYTLKAFRIQLQVWCYKKNILWEEHTKLFCLNYFPIYMDLLEKEVFNDKSPIWEMNYNIQDLKREANFLEY